MILVNKKNILLKSFFALGGHHFSKFLSRKHPRILMYHRFGNRSDLRRVGADVFEEQIKILRRGFNIISLSSLCTFLSNGDPIAPNAIVITVDDGYEDFYLYAYPILKKYSVSATIYITSDFIDGKIWLWPDVIEFILSKTQYNTFSIKLNGNETQYDLTNDDKRLRAWSDIADYCLTLKNDDKNEFLKQLAHNLKVHVPSSPISEYKPLSWKQIVEMKEHGIEIGSHTCTHPRLVMLDNANLRYEIEGSKKRIENMINQAIDSFCYPHGTKIDFNNDIKKMVINTGYKNATSAFSDSDATTDLFELRRYSIGTNMLRFKENVYGIKFLSNKIKKL